MGKVKMVVLNKCEWCDNECKEKFCSEECEKEYTAETSEGRGWDLLE